MENVFGKLLIMLLIFAILCYAPARDDTETGIRLQTEVSQEENIGFLAGLLVFVVVIIFILVIIDLLTPASSETEPINNMNMRSAALMARRIAAEN